MAAPPRHILTVNAGSSSLKLRVLGSDDELLYSRDDEAIGEEAELIHELEGVFEENDGIDAAAHRVVHGGPDFDGPTVIDPAVERELEALDDLAPLHNPPAVRAIRALERLRPGLPTVACFDTSFHATLPPAASTYALPAEWSQRWQLRRYGFHGLSHAYASQRAAELLERPVAELRLVTAHLGAGASLAAVAGGRSVDTTMGFTPLEGLVMATRSGSVDPGLLLWVQSHGGLGAGEVEWALDREAGLRGLSGGSGDIREVIEGAERGEERCQLALDVYLHRLGAGIAAMAAAMGGLDGLVFTGGIGENSATIRAAACESAAFLGVDLDPGLNARANPDAVLSDPAGPVATLVVSAREDLEMAKQARLALDRPVG